MDESPEDLESTQKPVEVMFDDLEAQAERLKLMGREGSQHLLCALKAP